MISVRYHAHQLELSGYGRAAAGYLAALEYVNDAAGGDLVQLDVVPVESPPSSVEVDIAIYHTTPGRLVRVQRSPARRHVALTTWETDPMPEEYAELLWGDFDAVIVPSNFCKQLFRMPSGRDEHSLKSRTHVVPHGFDPRVWIPRTEPRPPSSDGVFTFYSIGAWGERKNTIGLLKAYLHAFRKRDKTRLVLIVDKAKIQAIHSVLARSLIPASELPGLLVPDQRLSDEEIVSLHRDGSCFVTATRSEGFGLPIFEAAIMGKPIITPLWGGQMEFLSGYGNARSVWHAMTPVFPGEDEVSIEGNAMRLAVTIPDGANATQLWAEPSLERLAREMRAVREGHPSGPAKDDHSRRPWFEKHFGLEAIGTKFLNALKEILDEKSHGPDARSHP